MKVKRWMVPLILSFLVLATGLMVFLGESYLSLIKRILVFSEEILIVVFILLFHRADSPTIELGFALIGIGTAFQLLSHPISFLGSVLVLAGLVVVILYAKSLLNKLKERAYLDHLTRLYTRAFFFEEWLPKEINRQEREENGRITFIFIDLDNLKEINDRFSHQTGDEALKILAKAIKENIRLTDAAVRYGGDEFLIALPSEGIDTAKKVIRRIRNSVRREKFKTSISITAGITEWKVGEDIVKAIKEADRKMYEFKRKKKCKNLWEGYQDDSSY